MKKPTLFTAMLIISNLLSAQWIIQQNPSYPSGHDLNDIFFIDQEQGLTVGSQLQLLTTDGGNSWDFNLMSQWTLNSVFFVDDLNGWACGGGIFHTNDGIGINSTWEQQLYNSNNPLHLPKLFFIDTLTGWCVGSHPSSFNTCELLKTIDGGATWVQKYAGFGWLFDITFSDNLNGWAVGQTSYNSSDVYSILHSNDGGETWEGMTSAPTIPINSVFFVDSLNGWITGNNIGLNNHNFIYHTDNGGENWVLQHDTLSSSGANDITFTDLNNGWAVGKNGSILNTSDGGQNWEYQESGTTAWLNSVYFVDENHGWICGDSAIILYTDNGGTVGINEYSKIKNKLNIFPNPSNNIATITFEFQQKELITLSVLNIRGQEVKQISLGEKEKGQIDLDCSNFSPGIYFINLQTEKGILTEKLIIE